MLMKIFNPKFRNANRVKKIQNWDTVLEKLKAYSFTIKLVSNAFLIVFKLIVSICKPLRFLPKEIH